jgi:hypothetical protein
VRIVEVGSHGMLAIGLAGSDVVEERAQRSAWQLGRGRLLVAPGLPGCLPGRRPDDVHHERCAGSRYGKSDDGADPTSTVMSCLAACVSSRGGILTT